MRRPASLIVAVILWGLCAGAPAAGPASAAVPRTSLPVIERQVMCVTCKIPLNVAQSPQADRERAYIQSLIDEGQTEAQIKSSLVAQYGPAVLGMPAAHGFDLAAYLVPIAAVIVLLGVLAMLLPRWRRQARAQAALEPKHPALDAADAARLDADLARFE
ncbi:MAG TPA: cytochrome c-type biogenesis protein CcmH [Solirubrobacteraceae bacterium]|nr:cytochrome c-type biogenesis protein CcmH [Solirubrobacteraceae bacterium]